MEGQEFLQAFCAQYFICKLVNTTEIYVFKPSQAILYLSLMFVIVES